jgi:hypothetical protein
MKIPLHLLVLVMVLQLSASWLHSQAVPAPRTTAVMADPATSVVVWPPDFSAANLTPALNGKLDRVTTTGDTYLLYGVRTSGQFMLPATSGLGDGDNLVLRDGAGRFETALTPVSPYQVPSKAYVDARTPQPAVMVCTFQLGDAWTDFEIKITATNFGERPGAVLYRYYHSPDPSGTLVAGQVGPPPAVWFTDSGPPDGRRLRKQTGTQPIGYLRSGPTATISSVMVVYPVDSIIRPDNPALTISYMRWTIASPERDAGNHTIWRLAEPSWRTVAPAP